MVNDRFASTVDIWIYKPHVVHRRIFGTDVVPSDDVSRLSRTIVTRHSPPNSSFHEIIHRSNSESLFESDHIKYSLYLDGGKIVSKVLYDDGLSILTSDWIFRELPRKLNRLLAQSPRSMTASLSLLDVGVYHEVYCALKSKHARRIVEEWCEKTDPLKFVHEDLGIAAYLICLWKQECEIPTYFIDVGCGNGLLVYLLLLEGFQGIGIDVRKRAIWSTYPDLVQQSLLEISLYAERSPGFPTANWLIGNHSDELTPWLPVLAARSGPTCRVFALPCCPFGLYGKYNNFSPNDCHTTSIKLSTSSAPKSGSRYGMYINYLEKLFHLCGFVPERDVLRIPSTRRVCIVGRRFHSTSQTERLAKIEQIVEAEKVAASATTFVPRDATEPVLNCTQLPLDVKRSVCDLIFTALLSQPPDEPELRMWNLTVSDDGRIRTTDGRWWNPGGHLSLSETTKMIPQEHLAAMKTQHGGLQTLLRNHYQAFNVVGGSVRLRWLPEKIAKPNIMIPAIQRPTVKSAKRKTKPCWMFTNHPDGCPYSEAECDFVHATIEN